MPPPIEARDGCREVDYQDNFSSSDLEEPRASDNVPSAGIVRGDVVVAINGHALETVDWRTWRTEWANPQGVTLSIRRGGS